MHESLFNDIEAAKVAAQQLKDTWYQVYLKSGQTLNFCAHMWDVSEHEFQESDPEDPDCVPIKVKAVFFFDKDGESVCELFLPFSEVACIRCLNPAELAADDFEET